MRRADRLFEIIQLLRRAKSAVAAGAIAAELDTSTRTIYRDIAALVAQQVPIRGEAGVGFILDSGYDLPPLMLTPTEAEAIALGVEWVRTHCDHDLAQAATEALHKLRSVVPERLRARLDDPVVGTLPSLKRRPASLPDLAQLRKSSEQGLKVSFRYTDESQQETSRTVWPFMMGYFSDLSVVTAWCELRQDFRIFRTDRMQDVTFGSEHYADTPAALRRRWLALQRRNMASVGASGAPAEETFAKLPVIEFATSDAFDSWLSSRRPDDKGVWVKFSKKAAVTISLSKQDAIDVALCHGWIDGQAAKYDELHYLTRFTPRRRRSNWSQINRARAQVLIEEGRMRPTGLEQIRRAKEDGRWDAAYAPPSRATLPADLRAALESAPGAVESFELLNRAERWSELYGLATARKPDTRVRRITDLVAKLQSVRNGAH